MNRDSNAGVRVTRIRLENWRNFTKAEVELQQRVFLVGPNASGKSNFLDALRFLHDLAEVGGGFQDAVGRRGGVSSLRALAARQKPDIAIEVDLGTDDEVQWTYELRFSQPPKSMAPIVKRERASRGGHELLLRPDKDDERDPARLTQTHLEQVNVNRDFREVAEFFTSIRYLHIVPQLVREPARSVGKVNDPYGGDFLERVAKTNERTRQARLRRIQQALKVAVPQLQELLLSRDEKTGTPHLRGKYEHWRAQGAWQTEERFSDGTLRLLGLLWAALDEGGPLLLEEPELSLHPEVVRFLPQLFWRVTRKSGRQILISTHSPELLSDSGIGLDEVLLLIPEREGTRLQLASSIEETRELLRGGLSLPESVLPRTRPQHADQLALFPSQ